MQVRRFVRCVAVAALVAAGLLSGCGGSGSIPKPTTQGSFRGVASLPPGLLGRPAPRMRQTDVRGGVLDTNALRGRPYAVTFLYVNCPDVCPLITQETVQALHDLGAQAGRVAVVAVSVDPRGDTRANVEAFLARHRAPANFHYLIGSEAQLAPIWRGYRAAPQIVGDPNSSHTAAIWLIDRRGRLAAEFDAGAAFDPSDLAHDMEVLLT